jgi:sulfide:quinone oxidoreductase
MLMRKLTEDISVAGQIEPGDVAMIARAGFRSVVCNRPDGEGSDQPAFADIARACAAVGLESRYLPITPGQLGAGEAESFSAAVRELPSPILLYCRSGARSTLLWTLAERQHTET